MTGKATDTDVPLIDTSNNERLLTAKTMYRDIPYSLT
jgi:hypothetical protein